MVASPIAPTSTCRPSTLSRISPSPRKVTRLNFTEATCSRREKPICGMLPSPAWPTFTAPGRLRAASTISPTLRNGESAATATASGSSKSWHRKSTSAFVYGRFLLRNGWVTKAPAGWKPSV